LDAARSEADTRAGEKGISGKLKAEWDLVPFRFATTVFICALARQKREV